MPHDPARFARRAAFRRMAVSTVLAIVAAATITVRPPVIPAVATAVPTGLASLQASAQETP